MTHSNVTVSGAIPSYVEGGDSATAFESVMDGILGIAFLVIAGIAAKRMSWSRQQGGAEMTVVTAFYSLRGTIIDMATQLYSYCNHGL
jgi:hypothetical protein